MGLFFLTKIEKTVFKNVSEEPSSVTQIALHSNLPRTTVGGTLKRLFEYGLVKQSHSKRYNSHLYYRANQKDFSFLIDRLERSLLTKKEEKEEIFIRKDSSMILYSGQRGVRRALRVMLSAKPGSRVYLLQGSESVQPFIDLVGEDEVTENNLLFKQNELILTVIKEDFSMKELVKNQDHYKTYVGRPADKRTVPKKFFENPSSLFVFDNSLMIFNIEGAFAVEVRDKIISSVIKKMLVFMLEHADKIGDVNK